MKTYHHFSSYKSRSVFEPREELDKFFDTDSARQALSPRRPIRKFETVIERRDPKLSESVALAYETLPAVLKLK
jgi:hypothetical protein